MSQALYRKWRPRTFAEIVGQSHITQTLRNALKTSRIVHAYLFSGPRGTGKTSTARILAKAVNCLDEGDDKPCNACRMCQAIDEGRAIDLIEIDAASNTGVDDIRELREKIGFAPGEARYKFYIIDEVHMLSGSAFNALLKTLEEPPPHAILVLATTEPHKIPATVLSRCQRFDFRPITVGDMMGRLQKMATQEGVEIEDAALDLIARQSTGSMRDAESLLDQLASYGAGRITLEQVQTILGTVSSQAVKQLVDDLAKRDMAAGLEHIGKAIADGADPRQLNKELLQYLHGLLILKTTNDGPSHVTEEQRREMVQQVEQFTLDRLLTTIKLFGQATLNLRIGPQPQLPLELALVEATLPREVETGAARKSSPTQQTDTSRNRAEAEKARASQAQDLSPRRDRTAHKDSLSAPPRQVKETPVPATGEGKGATLETLGDNWSRILTAIRSRNRHIEAILKDCELASVEGDVITLSARWPFHKEKLEEERAKELVEQVVGAIVGQPCRVKCILSTEEGRQQPPRKASRMEGADEDPVVKAALAMGAEIVEVSSTSAGTAEETGNAPA